MSNSVNVDVVITEAPFGVSGSISVTDEAVFDASRAEFNEAAILEIKALGRSLHELAMAEYDRRNA